MPKNDDAPQGKSLTNADLSAPLDKTRQLPGAQTSAASEDTAINRAAFGQIVPPEKSSAPDEAPVQATESGHQSGITREPGPMQPPVKDADAPTKVDQSSAGTSGESAAVAFGSRIADAKARMVGLGFGDIETLLDDMFASVAKLEGARAKR